MRQPDSVHPLIALSLFEALRNLDTPVEDGLADVADELVAKRLGLSATVTAQIERFRQAARSGDGVSLDEVTSIFRLVARRPDASLVFADAGRRAARYAVRGAAAPARVLMASSPGFIRRRVGLGTARRVAVRFFEADLRGRTGAVEVKVAEPISIAAAADGKACAFYGAAFGEMLRLLTAFEGAMVHDQCRGKGAAMCHWKAARAEGYE